jgi:hypothetical protein
MTSFGTAVAAASAIAATLLSTTALAQDWVINKVSGKVSVGAAGSPARAVAAGMSVSQGSTITTGANARAMLVRGSETLVVGPNSAIAIQPGQGGLTTTILQKAGQLTVDVETKQAPHFSVETPFMAAVVKGTMFDVRVSTRDASVSVQRGRVQVADFATGQTADITPGQRASVRQGGRPGLNLSGKGQMPAIQSGTPRPALVTPLGGQTAAQPAAAATAAAAAPRAATSFDSSSAGFGPGRSWSGPLAGENKSRGGANKGQSASVAVTSNGVSSAATPGNSGLSVGPSNSGKSGLTSNSGAPGVAVGPGNSGLSGSSPGKSGLSSNSGTPGLSVDPGNSGQSGNSGKSRLLSTVGTSVSSSGPGNSGLLGTPGNSGQSGTSGNSASSGSTGGGKGSLGRR